MRDAETSTPLASTTAKPARAEVAGTASALLGSGRFALVAPLVGAGGTDSAVPMASIMVVVALCALAARHVAARPARTDRLRRAYLEGLHSVEARAPGVVQLTLDSTAITLDDCVAIIAEAARRWSTSTDT
jgi:hypothetical protein